MIFLLFFIVAIWMVRIFANICTYIQLWYVKEYRFDRMFIHLKTNQGKRIFLSPFRRPHISPKSVILISLTTATVIILFDIIKLNIALRLIIIDVITFPITGFFVLLLSIPTRILHEIVIFLAITKLRRHKKMIVVGITGSFGKTSTKEFISTIFSHHWKTLKTEASKNSSIGIAEIILKSLDDSHEAFIVEMGAYKRGEIAEMADMVRPEIGVVTAINPQHQDLFKTIETTKKAKYELIEGLVGRRIAIFNADNDKTLEMAQWAKRDGCSVWLYTTHYKNLASQGQALRSYFIVYGSDIESTMDDVHLTVNFQNKKSNICIKVAGEHQISNMLASVSVALACGMNFDVAIDAAKFIITPDKTLKHILGPLGCMLIDDTFNNNPDAAIAAIKYLAQAKGKKLLVFQPMIELGTYAQASHELVGEIAGKVCDYIILTNNNYFADFLRGVKKSSPSKNVYMYTPSETAAFITSHITTGDIVLFKGKEAEPAIRLLRRK